MSMSSNSCMNSENSWKNYDSPRGHLVIEDSPEEQPTASPQLDPSISSDDSYSEYNENFLDDVYEEESWSSDSDNRKETSLAELADFICAAQMARAEDPYLLEDVKALPLSKRWWPSWDTREYLNCLQAAIGSARLTDMIRKAVEDFDGEPPMGVQKYVLEQCRKWNLVWVGRNKVALLEPDEVEMLLGFLKNYTRGGGISKTDRYKSLGNSFQVDTVTYHLSVLKDLYPEGINVLSLFSGIGGAEVALYRLGNPLKNVVSVENSEGNRNIVRSWLENTTQRGNLIDFDDVRQLDGYRLEQLIDSFGGSPCNNLAGSNRVSRDRLEGKESSLFLEYPRILDLVKNIMSGDG
ncbi:hypothetical protein RND71_007087 [Anisodus tanguticus]|uniref:DNA (cytosine-5-)-methyltransferase n=1 Tax=Anisodus tanguticus TaxID=243964 RepID=A0AAE1SLQ5_9SOLA|nr:hypothetical protein RND71_007087 [Anisodus tanguticus]